MAHGHAHEEAEHAEHSSHDPFDKRVALSMVVIAALLASVKLLGHRAGSDSSGEWNGQLFDPRWAERHGTLEQRCGEFHCSQPAGRHRCPYRELCGARELPGRLCCNQHQGNEVGSGTNP